ncbi:MAG TPA: Xaa-Pro peptidase family protein [Vicinamibacteria bacterium]
MRSLLAVGAVLGLVPIAAGQDVPLFTSDFPPEEFASRRAAVYDAIGPQAVAVLQGAPSPVGYTRFRQANDFYYLCGVESPHAYLLLDGERRRATLYLPHRNEARERGEGKLLAAEDSELVRKLAGVDEVSATEALGEQLARLARSGATRAVHAALAPAEGAATSRDLALRATADAAADPWDGLGSREGRFAELLRVRFPRLEVRDLSTVLDRLRLIKSPREIALVKRATRLASLAILEAMRSTEPGLFEHELDAVARFIFFRNGAQGEAYYSLIASGPNAWFPHYNAGRRQMKDGELLLMDFAPDVGYYMSDVTRVWPVNGRFNDWQRELYGFYLGCYRAILSAIRPGETASAIKARAAADMERLLAATRFSKPIYESAAREFVKSYRGDPSQPARLGHWVGMATHDVGEDSGPLRAGMVFTIEPALRVPEERVYIRLEDLIVIGPDKAEVVSGWLPSDMAEIEKVMRESGILQRYPRDAASP